MDIDPADLGAEYRRARDAWPFIDGIEHLHGLPRLLMYAVGSRETNLTNEVGDGGHGHGVWQLDNRSHVIPAGFDADVQEQCATAANMLASLIHSFPSDLAAAVAAYNAGAGTSQYNREHGLNIDTGTAGGDYSADVLARLAWLQLNFPDPTQPAPTNTEGDYMYSWIVCEGVDGDRKGQQVAIGPGKHIAEPSETILSSLKSTRLWDGQVSHVLTVQIDNAITLGA